MMTKVLQEYYIVYMATHLKKFKIHLRQDGAGSAKLLAIKSFKMSPSPYHYNDIISERCPLVYMVDNIGLESNTVCKCKLVHRQHHSNGYKR